MSVSPPQDKTRKEEEDEKHVFFRKKIFDGVKCVPVPATLLELHIPTKA